MNHSRVEEHAHEDKRFKPTQFNNQSPGLNSQNIRERVDIQEIINFVKQLNSAPTETQSSPEQSQPPSPPPSKSKATKTKNPPLIIVPNWIVNKATIATADQKMINSQHQKIPILLIFDLNTILSRRKAIKKPIHLRPHIHEFIEFIMENFYVMSWTTCQTHSYETVSAVFGPYTDYVLCNLTRHHCDILPKDFEKPKPTKDLSIIWDNTFMIDPTTVMRTLPSPPTREELQHLYIEDISLINDPAVRDLYLGINPSQQPRPNARPLRFDKTNTILFDDTISRVKLQPQNHILIPEYMGLISNKTDIELLTLKNYLQSMAIQYRLEFDKCEEEGTEFYFSVQDYMKDNPFTESNPQLV